MKKTAYLWIVDAGVSHHRGYPYHEVHSDLFFSSHLAFETVSGMRAEDEQLVPVQVPQDFDRWDFIPDNY